MRFYEFKCSFCQTKMTIETTIDDRNIHKVPPCPCGNSRMILQEDKEYKFIKETNLGLEEIENPDHCLCLDCQVAKDGL